MEPVSFSANLITIAIVFIILIIYRYLDRNNRSLEKVKRFSDKVKDDLSVFIDEKSQEIRNLAIDMQVNLKTGKEILHRINDIELELKNKADTIDEVHNRVNQYDSLIEELNKSTIMVEENLKRIHEESGFIDKVGKKVKDSSNKLLQLEKSIPAIRDNISAQNLENLNKAKKQILEGIRERISQASDEVNALEGRIKDFSTYITHLESRRDSLGHQLIKNLESVYNNFEVKAGQRREHMAKEFQVHLDGILRASYQKKDAYKAEMEELVASAEVEISSNEDRLLKSLIEFKKDVEHTEVAYQQKLGKVAEAGKKLENEVFTELKQKLENNSAKLHNEIQKKLDGFAREVEARNNDILTILGKLKQNTEVWKTGVAKKIEKMVKDLNTQFIEGKAGIETAMQEYIQQKLDQQKSFEAEINGFVQESQNKMNILEVEYAKKIEEIDMDFSSFKNDYHIMIEELEKKNSAERESLLVTFEEKLAGLEKQLAVRSEKVKKDVDEINHLSEDIEFRVTNIRKDLQECSCNLLGKIDGFRTDYTQKIDAAAHDVESGVISRIDERLRDYENDVNYRFSKLEKVNVDIEALAGNLREVIDSKKEEVQKDFEVFIASLDEKRLVDKQAAEAMIEGIQNEIKELEGEVQQLKTDAYQDVSQKLQIFEDEFFEDLKKRSEAIEKSLDEWQSEVKERINEFERNFESEREGAFDQYSKTIEANLKQLGEKTDLEIKTIETRISDFKQTIRHYMEEGEGEWEKTFTVELEKYRAEIDERIAGMRTTIEATISEIEEEYATQQKDIVNRADAERMELKEEFIAISDRLETFGNELEEKTKTHLVSFDSEYNKKQEEFSLALKNLQNEFAQQIREFRNTMLTIEEEFSNQQKDIAKRTDAGRMELKEELIAISDQLEIFEKGLEEKTKTHLESFDSEYNKKQEEFTLKLKNLQSEFEQQIRDFRDTVSSGQEYIEQTKKEQIDEIEKRYNNMVTKLDTIEEKQEHLNSQIMVLEKAEAFIVKLEKELKTMNDVVAELEPEREKIYAMEEEFEKIRENMEKVTSDIEQMNMTLSREYKTIEEQALHGKRNLKDFMLTTEQEIDDISKRIVEQNSELTERMHDALESFNAQYEELKQEFTQMASISKEEFEKRIGTFEKNYREDNEKVKQTQDRLVARIEAEYRRLTEDLIEIQKQQQNFTAQTRLFERADTLKIQLRNEIDELKKDLKTIEPSRKKMNAIAVEIVKVNKMADEVNAKATRYFAEKRRFESMEKNFNELMKISDEIEEKLKSVTGASDTLQEIKLKIRELSEIGKMTEAQYGRLEKKKEVLETTAKGVDKNFRILEELEKEIRRIKESVSDIPPKVLTIGQEIKFLIENKPKADMAVSQLQKIDELMGDIEERTDRLMTARQWLARTETRLESIGKNAQDQLKLLQALMKDEGHNGTKSKGAPAPDKRQMIVKLARQGWSPKEIAKATNTSLGEVELILELEPKKR